MIFLYSKVQIREIMENKKQINNNIFTAAFAGVILLIISLALSILATKVGHAKDIPYIAMSLVTGMSGISLLSYAVKKEHRNEEMDTNLQ